MGAEQRDFRAGAGIGKIEFPGAMFPLEGFCRVQEPPFVKVLIFGTEELAAIVSVELVLLPEELIRYTKNLLQELAGIPEERVWVAVTHAISTPHAPEGEKRPLYEEAVKTAVNEAAQQAVAALTAAKMGVGLCVSDVIENRDIMTPEGPWIGRGGFGPANKIVNVLRFESRSGQLLAVLINFAMKPAVLDNSQRAEEKRVVSPDAAGYACTMLSMNAHVPVLYTMSGAADQVTQETALYNKIEGGKLVEKDLGVEAGLAMVRRIGSTLAMDVLSILNAIECVPIEKPVLLAKSHFPWPGKEAGPARPSKNINFVALEDTTVDVSVMSLGPVMLVACKPEVNCLTELQLRARCPSKYTLLLTMVDGGMKYMPDITSYSACTWEAQNSLLMPGAAEKFVRTACDMAAGLSE